MVRVLICDDDSIFSELLQAQVQKAFDEQHIKAQVNCCNSVSALHAEIKQQYPDLLFLDLMLKDADGYQIAKEIRSAHAQTEIVFITNYPERMQDAFAYKPIGFICKPGSQEDISNMIHRFLLYYRELTHHYVIQTREQINKIPVDDIIYFESSAHQVLIHCKSRPEPFSQIRRLDEIDSELKELFFIRIHKSFLVHAHSILRLDKSHMLVHLKCGKTLPISRSYYTHAVEQFVQHQLR